MLDAKKALKDTARIVNILAVLSVAVPLLLYAIAAWFSYHAHFVDAQRRLESTADVVREHAIKVFDTHLLTTLTVNEILRGMSEDQILIRQDELNRRLKNVIQGLPQIQDAWVLDLKGLLIANTFAAPPGRDYSDREYFKAFQSGAKIVPETYLGGILKGRFEGSIFFTVATARRDANENFAGVISSSVNPGYFGDFYKQVAETGFSAVSLFREDGAILARFPGSHENLLNYPKWTMLTEKVSANPREGFLDGVKTIDGVERQVAYSRVTGYPVYVTVSMNRRTIIGAWLEQMTTWALIVLPVIFALLGLSLVALRYTRKEAVALERLRREMSLRETSEAQLRQLQKMEAIGQLTGGIAHDFNNLLTIIIGSLNLMQRRMARGETDVIQFVDGAMDGAKRAATLVAQLLAFARKQPLEPKPTDVNRLLTGMSDLLQRTLGGQVMVETVQSGGLWLTNIDANQLENALINLAVNARDAMPDGGKLTLETANTYLDDEYCVTHAGLTAGQYVVICVTDTGAGMPPEVAAKAFEPFFTTKESGRGTGLGLSQVYGFVKQSNGHVKIYSEIGHGTTVKIYMPRYIDSVASAEVKRETSAVGARGVETILLVEDEEGVRQFARQALEELGYRTLTADGAAMAMQILKDEAKIDLLLTDIVMPQTNGKHLAERIMRKRPGIKVLYMTGYSRNAIIHNGVLDPGVSLLNKPFTLDQLGTKVRMVLDS